MRIILNPPIGGEYNDVGVLEVKLKESSESIALDSVVSVEPTTEQHIIMYCNKRSKEEKEKYHESKDY